MNEVMTMGFKVNREKGKAEESSNKTIRLKNNLIDTLQTIANENDISFNNLVVQMLEYSLKNMEK